MASERNLASATAAVFYGHTPIIIPTATTTAKRPRDPRIDRRANKKRPPPTKHDPDAVRDGSCNDPALDGIITTHNMGSYAKKVDDHAKKHNWASDRIAQLLAFLSLASVFLDLYVQPVTGGFNPNPKKKLGLKTDPGLSQGMCSKTILKKDLISMCQMQSQPWSVALGGCLPGTTTLPSIIKNYLCVFGGVEDSGPLLEQMQKFSKSKNQATPAGHGGNASFCGMSPRAGVIAKFRQELIQSTAVWEQKPAVLKSSNRGNGSSSSSSNTSGTSSSDTPSDSSPPSTRPRAGPSNIFLVNVVESRATGVGIIAVELPGQKPLPLEAQSHVRRHQQLIWDVVGECNDTWFQAKFGDHCVGKTERTTTAARFLFVNGQRMKCVIPVPTNFDLSSVEIRGTQNTWIAEYKLLPEQPPTVAKITGHASVVMPLVALPHVRIASKTVTSRAGRVVSVSSNPPVACALSHHCQTSAPITAAVDGFVVAKSVDCLPDSKLPVSSFSVPHISAPQLVGAPPIGSLVPYGSILDSSETDDDVFGYHESDANDKLSSPFSPRSSDLLFAAVDDDPNTPQSSSSSSSWVCSSSSCSTQAQVVLSASQAACPTCLTPACSTLSGPLDFLGSTCPLPSILKSLPSPPHPPSDFQTPVGRRFPLPALAATTHAVRALWTDRTTFIAPVNPNPDADKMALYLEMVQHGQMSGTTANAAIVAGAASNTPSPTLVQLPSAGASSQPDTCASSSAEPKLPPPPEPLAKPSKSAAVTKNMRSAPRTKKMAPGADALKDVLWLTNRTGGLFYGDSVLVPGEGGLFLSKSVVKGQPLCYYDGEFIGAAEGKKRRREGIHQWMKSIPDTAKCSIDARDLSIRPRERVGGGGLLNHTFNKALQNAEFRIVHWAHGTIGLWNKNSRTGDPAVLSACQNCAVLVYMKVDVMVPPGHLVEVAGSYGGGVAYFGQSAQAKKLIAKFTAAHNDLVPHDLCREIKDVKLIPLGPMLHESDRKPSPPWLANEADGMTPPTPPPESTRACAASRELLNHIQELASRGLPRKWEKRDDDSDAFDDCECCLCGGASLGPGDRWRVCQSELVRDKPFPPGGEKCPRRAHLSCLMGHTDTLDQRVVNWHGDKMWCCPYCWHCWKCGKKFTRPDPAFNRIAEAVLGCYSCKAIRCKECCPSSKRCPPCGKMMIRA